MLTVCVCVSVRALVFCLPHISLDEASSLLLVVDMDPFSP